MSDQSVQRRLAAVLAADVAGYTRLMEMDSDGTVAAWQDARETVIRPGVAEYSGKIVKLTGDGFLVEFSTVQDAVNCAIALQAGLVDSSLDFRMGVNLGDIIDDGEDIHGEGVNVAARLEGLAEPGGICISGMVYESIRNRIEAAFEDMGEQDVKNVSAPVRTYRIRLSGKAEAALDYAISSRPSIAVLPFDNLSGEAAQEYFSDGISEDIITALSRSRWLRVVARNSSFSYKGPVPRHPHRLEGAGRALCARRQRPQGRRAGAYIGAAHRWGQRRPYLGGTLRPRARRHFRRPGRDHRHRRGGHCAGAGEIRNAAGVVEIPCQPGCLGPLPSRHHGFFSAGYSERRQVHQPPGTKRRTGPGFLPCLGKSHRIPVS
jgi:class 3 adenylate cyclase